MQAGEESVPVSRTAQERGKNAPRPARSETGLQTQGPKSVDSRTERTQGYVTISPKEIAQGLPLKISKIL